MKIVALVLIAIILIMGPAVTLEVNMSYGLFGSANYLLGNSHNLNVQVLDSTNQYTTVAIASQLNVTLTTMDSSTIVEPPVDIKNKIDSNLLNLTELVTEGYLKDNQTNVIMSFSDSNIPEKAEGNTLFASLINSTQALYRSKRADRSMNYVEARLNYTTILELAETPQIAHVWLDSKIQPCLDQSVGLIKDPAEWMQIESSFSRSIDGSGIRIAILDTGIDASHPDFYFPNGTSKIAAAISFTGESATDEFGHGTHVASIAAGTGAASLGQYTGVAPGATLLNVKVLDDMGEGSESWVISGIQWAVDNNATILNMSFSDATNSNGTDPVSTTVNWATARGVVCILAAGNSGPSSYTIGSPGAAESAITVGASTKNDTLFSYSSTGPTSDNRTKPDVLAPGVDIVAARATGTAMGTPISQYYTMASGTSMAAPHVAGAAALLLDAHPSWTPQQVKMAFANYAKDIGSTILQQGAGRIDVCRAINASILATPSISFGTVGSEAEYTSNVTIQNLAQETINVTLNVETWHISDGTRYPTSASITANLTLSPENTTITQLDLNTSAELPSGLFQGTITVAFDTETIVIPFFFIVEPAKVEVSDVSIIEAASSKTIASGNVTLTLTVIYQGDLNETFDVTTYANTTTIETQQTTLTSGTNANLSFTWDTTNFQKGNYTISVSVRPQLNETGTTTSTVIIGWVIVTIPGDLNGDFRVSLIDLRILANAYGSEPGDPNWNPNADFGNNGVVDLSDLVALGAHYGQNYP